MKTLKTLRALAVGLVAALFVYSAPTISVYASDQFEWLAARLLSGEATSGFNSAISTHTPLLVEYIGTAASPSGLVAVAANGDLTFTQGAAGAEAATAEFECPVSGALGGVIDVSDAACDTLQEVCDVINGAGTGSTYTSNTSWRCVILDGLAADSSNDTLVTISATQAAVAPGGLALAGDTAVTFDVARALLPSYMRTMDWYLDGSPLKQLKPKPFDNIRGHLLKSIATSTYGSGTSTFELFSVRDTFSRTAYGQKLTETTTQLWSQAGGATTVAGTADFTPLGIQGETDAKLVARINNSAANTATTFTNWALQYPWRK